MKKILKLAFVIFKEIAREKIFWGLIFLGAFFLLSSLILKEMVVGEKFKVFKDIGLLSPSIIGVLFITVVGANIISREVSAKTLYLILSKPISKSGYVLSNFIALVFLSFLIILSITFVGWFFLLLNGENWIYGFAVGSYFLFFELLLLSALSIFLSTFLSPYLSMITFFILYISGHSLPNALQLSPFAKSEPLQIFLKILSYLLPNLEIFNFKTQLVYNLSFPKSSFIFSPTYSIFYSILLLSLAFLIFSKREL
ncbi:MAG: ABC transporter permease subunit [Candidatus Aminicenantia bacterium]